ncbi:hypothetical protein PAMP_014086 [Pampus punctatissimus]
MKPSKPLKHPVAVVKLSSGVETRAGLRLIIWASSIGVHPEPTWPCISNRLDLLYLGAEPLLRSDLDQSERHACEERLNSGDLAAQDKTTCILVLLPESRASPFLTHTLTQSHSEGRATGVRPCSAVETKHWPVLTGCDPCFRAECCQRRIDGSHPEEDIYRKILLAGILVFILDSKQGSQSLLRRSEVFPK